MIRWFLGLICLFFCAANGAAEVVFDEWFEERETAEVLCRRSLRAVFLLCLLRFETKGQFDAGDMADIAHSYSREIEHDEKNLEIMKGAF